MQKYVCKIHVYKYKYTICISTRYLLPFYIGTKYFITSYITYNHTTTYIGNFELDRDKIMPQEL